MRAVRESPEMMLTRPRDGRSIAAVLSTGFALRLAVALLPSNLLTGVVWDDAFYYIRIAQNLNSGAGSTFDGIHATNGYHPLWLILITPFTVIFSGITLVRVLVVFQALLAMATAILFVRIARPRLGSLPTGLGLALWWLSPLSATTSVAGLETALACLAVMVVIQSALRYRDDPTGPQALMLGAAAGVAFLARTDVVFALAAVAIWLVWQLRSEDGSRPRRRDLALALGAAAAVTAPWLLWNLIRFHTVEQVSAGARPLVIWNNLEATGVTGRTFGAHLLTVITSAIRFLVLEWPGQLGWSMPLLVAGVVATAWILKKHQRTPRVGPMAMLAGLVLLAGSALGMFHGAIRQAPRVYYFEWVRMSLGLLAAVITARALAGVATLPGADFGPQHSSRMRACSAVTAILCLLGTLGSLQRIFDSPYNWQSGFVEAGDWLKDNTKPQERVLAFNAGIVGYFSERVVINLDGVVNNAAYDALESRDLAAYMCDSGAGWFVDLDPAMLDEYSDFMGRDADRLEFEPVTTIETSSSDLYGASNIVVSRFSCKP